MAKQEQPSHVGTDPHGRPGPGAAFYLGQAAADTLLEKLPDGHLKGWVARHRAKWLPDESSITTIPLTEAEYGQVRAALGGDLEPVDKG